MAAERPSSLTRLRAVDCAEVEAWAVDAGWDIDYQQMGSGQYDARLSAVECGAVIATSEIHNLALAAWGTPAAGTACLFLCESESPVRFRGSELGDCEGFFLRAGEEAVASWGPMGSRGLGITMSWRDICHAVASWGYEPEDVLSTRGTVRLGQAQRQTLVHAVRDALDESADVTKSPSDLEQELVAAFVDALVSAQGPRLWVERLEGYGAYVKRAQAYIEPRLDQAIRVVDLAEVAGTTARTLQSAFKEVLGVSPMRYVRTRRLSRIRRSLLRRRDGRAVTQLALEHGVKHLGRLSVDYRRLFGESPSATGAEALGDMALPEAPPESEAPGS